MRSGRRRRATRFSKLPRSAHAIRQEASGGRAARAGQTHGRGPRTHPIETTCSGVSLVGPARSLAIRTIVLLRPSRRRQTRWMRRAAAAPTDPRACRVARIGIVISVRRSRNRCRHTSQGRPGSAEAAIVVDDGSVAPFVLLRLPHLAHDGEGASPPSASPLILLWFAGPGDGERQTAAIAVDGDGDDGDKGDRGGPAAPLRSAQEGEEARRGDLS